VNKRIDLLVPGLFGPVPVSPGDLPPVPALERLLGRGHRLPAPAADPLEGLAGRFGIRRELGHDLPSAPLCRLADHPAADSSGQWLHADPVHLRPDRDQLLLFDARHLALDRGEAGALIAELNDHFHAEGLRFEAPVPDRWYLRLDAAPGIRTRPLHAVAGRGVGPFLPEGEGRTRWVRLLNEAQMLLHHSEVNRARERSGRLTVSGVWFWGGGRLPARPLRADYGAVLAGHPLALGLARAAGIEGRALPEVVGEPIADQPGKALLIFWDRVWPAVLDADAAAWVRRLEELERFAAQLMVLLRKGRIDRLDLDPCDGSLFEVTRRGLRRFWRRSPPLAERLPRA